MRILLPVAEGGRGRLDHYLAAITRRNRLAVLIDDRYGATGQRMAYRKKSAPNRGVVSDGHYGNLASLHLSVNVEDRRVRRKMRSQPAHVFPRRAFPEYAHETQTFDHFFRGKRVQQQSKQRGYDHQDRYVRVPKPFPDGLSRVPQLVGDDGEPVVKEGLEE